MTSPVPAGRWERDATLRLAFMGLGCAIICHRQLKRF